MNRYKKVLGGVLCAACVLSAAAVPSFASSAPAQPAALMVNIPAIGEHIYNNQSIVRGERYEFSIGNYPCFQVTVNNTGKYDIQLTIYEELETGESKLWYSTTVDAGKSGGTGIKAGAANKRFHVSMNCIWGNDPIGTISIQTFPTADAEASEYIYYNRDVPADFELPLFTGSRSFYRAALHNTGKYDIRLRIYEVVKGEKVLRNTNSIKSGQWGATPVAENADNKDFIICMDCPYGTIPTGTLSLRASEHKFN